jgi:hypothetical protein
MVIKWDEEKRKTIYKHFRLHYPPVGNGKLLFSPSGKVYFNFLINGIKPETLTSQKAQDILDNLVKRRGSFYKVNVFAVSVRDGLRLGYADKSTADYFQVNSGDIGSYEWLADFANEKDAINFATSKGGLLCVYFNISFTVSFQCG